MLLRISHLDAHHRLICALVVAGLVAVLTSPQLSWPARVAMVWLGFSLTTLTLMWITITVAHPRDLPAMSRLQDSSRVWISVFVFAAAVFSLFVVIALLDALTKDNRTWRVVLAVLSVLCSWTLVHTVFTIRYAHLYYGDSPTQKKRPGGLQFPDDEEPDYLDFAYFSFVIGMTSQVSDVAVASKPMRRTALVHGVLSFAFNAVIIALTISGLSGLIS